MRSPQSSVWSARAWVASDDTRAPFAFLCLCDIFGLDPVWVRDVVRRRGTMGPRARRRMFSVHRHAA